MELDQKDRTEEIKLVTDWLTNFDAEVVRNSVLEQNIEFLEKSITNLETLSIKARNESSLASTSRARAVARDTEKSTNGLINGIKFAISFMMYGKEENLNDDIGIS